MILLQNDRLQVMLADPGQTPADRFRFDHAGLVTEVILDGRVHYCATEPQNLRHPSSGGRGLCNEYRTSLSDEAAVGEWFPKFGVGLIRKEADEKFVFWKRYREFELFEITVAQSENSVTYTTLPKACNGYALCTQKRISLAQNTLTMVITAENTGEKALELEEFCHNFLSIDGMAIGSDYQLSLLQGPDLGNERLPNRSGGRPGSMRGNGKGITFCEYSAIDTDYAIDPVQVEDSLPFRWSILHRGAKASVACEESFKPAKIAIWAVDHMFCPEIVHGFLLAPGETHTWTRTWTFDAL